MLKPASAFVYVCQDVSTSDAGTCVGSPDGSEEGDGVFVREVQDVRAMTKMRNRDCFFNLCSLEILK